MRKFIKKRVFFATTPFLNAMKTQKIVATSVEAMVLAILGFGCGVDTGEKFEQVPLASVYSSNGQEGIKQIDGSDSHHAEMLFAKSTRNGASNVYLVRATDIKGAISATNKIVNGAARCDNIDAGADGEAWMIVCLGVAGSDLGPAATKSWLP